MRVRIAKDDLSSPVVFDSAGTVVVYDDYDAPILLVQKMAKGLILTYTPSDPTFAKAMQTLGIGLNTRYKKVTSDGSRKTIAMP